MVLLFVVLVVTSSQDRAVDFRGVVADERERRKLFKAHATLMGEAMYAELVRTDADQRQVEDATLLALQTFAKSSAALLARVAPWASALASASSDRSKARTA